MVRHTAKILRAPPHPMSISDFALVCCYGGLAGNHAQWNPPATKCARRKHTRCVRRLKRSKHHNAKHKGLTVLCVLGPDVILPYLDLVDATDLALCTRDLWQYCLPYLTAKATQQWKTDPFEAHRLLFSRFMVHASIHRIPFIRDNPTVECRSKQRDSLRRRRSQVRLAEKGPSMGRHILPRLCPPRPVFQPRERR
jgi:hypothetical protein